MSQFRYIKIFKVRDDVWHAVIHTTVTDTAITIVICQEREVSMRDPIPWAIGIHENNYNKRSQSRAETASVLPLLQLFASGIVAAAE